MDETVTLTPEEAQQISDAFNSSVFNFSTVLGVILLLLGYALLSFGLYNLAKNNGVSRAWRAFIPVVQLSILGNLIDNKVWGFGHAGLILSLGLLIIIILYILPINIWYGFSLTVIYYVYIESALNQFYKDYDRNKGILFFMLGLFFPFTIPIWIFVERKKKKGEFEYIIER